MNEDIILELNNHIDLVGKYIDIICNDLVSNISYNCNIENTTLIDLLICLSYNKTLPKYDRLFVYLNNNTYMSYSNKESNRNNIIENFINELQSRKNNHDKLLLEKIKRYIINNPKIEHSSIEQIIQNHKCNSRHHIEYFASGINDMNIFDIVEMFCNYISIQNNEKLETINNRNLIKILKNTKKNLTMD